MNDTDPPRALDGIRVLDLSRILAGPWAALALGDLGADVIKIETPEGGDDIRRWGPPFIDGPETDSAYFTATSRNKRSVAVDFSTPEGAALVRDLALRSDVMVENFKTGGLAKYGLDYESLSKENPGLIYCSVTGFGHTGPYAKRAGYDFLIQAMGGLMSVTGHPDGVPGGGPMKTGVAIADMVTGLYAGIAILAALHHRNATGEGQHIDCALFDGQAAMLANQAQSWLVAGEKPRRLGNQHPTVVPYAPYPVKDGYIIIAVGNDGQFQRMCAAMDAPEIGGDSRFTTCPDRIVNRDALADAMNARLANFTRDEILARFEAATVPAGPLNEVPDVFADPQTAARGTVVEMQRPDGTEIKTVAFPPKLSRTPARYDHAPPALGASTDDVLTEILDLDAAAISGLRASGVIG